MPLLETLAFTLGPAIAKYIVKGWLGDSLNLEIAKALVDLVKGEGQNALTRYQDSRQVERIAEKVVKKLQPAFAHSKLDKDERNLVAHEFALTLANVEINADLLLSLRLDTSKLVKFLGENRTETAREFSERQEGLFEHLAEETSKEIVQIAAELSGFERDFARGVLTDLDRIWDAVEAMQQRPNQQAEKFEDIYRRQVITQLDRMETFGIPRMDDFTRKLSLSVAYITLEATRLGIDKREALKNAKRAKELNPSIASSIEEMSEEAWARGLSAKQYSSRSQYLSGSVDQILATSRRIVIRGQAGSGKTTLMRWVAVQAAKKTFEGELTGWNNTIPFFIRLREYVDTGFPELENIPSQLSKQMGGKPDHWVHEQLDTGRAIILVDGVDELPQEKRGEMLVALHDLLISYPLARYLVTSRPAALKDWPEWAKWIEVQGFAEVTLKDMTPSQINHFIDHWHHALSLVLEDTQEIAELAKKPEVLKRQLSRLKNLEKLAVNPLLCAMLCALHNERAQADLPARRNRLYYECIDMLLRRDEGRGIRDGKEYPLLDHDERLVLVRGFALWLIRNKYSDVPCTQADERFEKTLPALDREDISGEGVRRLFVERTSLLDDPVEGRVGFAHRTFQEYLAAQAIVEEASFGELLEKCGDDQWREMIILAVGNATTRTG